VTGPLKTVAPAADKRHVAETMTCVVADDHPAVLDAVSRYLAEHRVEVVARAREGNDALRQIEERRPDVAIVDLRMVGMDGLELARRAARSAPGTAIVIYSGHGEYEHVQEALDAGARGFVLKEAALPELVRALEIVRNGGTYVDAALAGGIAALNGGRAGPQLTARERDVLRLLSQGLSNEEIGREIFISAETVRTHIRKAMRKLDASTRTEAVATALRQSLIA
jgi:DNA-binding NarL/FixJ family response regulator